MKTQKVYVLFAGNSDSLVLATWDKKPHVSLLKENLVVFNVNGNDWTDERKWDGIE